MIQANYRKLIINANWIVYYKNINLWHYNINLLQKEIINYFYKKYCDIRFE